MQNFGRETFLKTLTWKTGKGKNILRIGGGNCAEPHPVAVLSTG
jgi:hypothetical protein